MSKALSWWQPLGNHFSSFILDSTQTVESFLYSVTFVLYESYMAIVHEGKKYSKGKMYKKPAEVCRRER